jgi:uncharacterized membrane protein YdbT with pleckstrin-like domain
MGFPENSLTPDEVVERHLHPHWRTVLIPALWGVSLLVLLVLAWIYFSITPFLIVGAILAILFVRYGLWPIFVWRSTHFVFTTSRVLMREGVFRNDQRDIPVSRLDHVSIRQTLVERMLGCGTLLIGPGKEPAERLANIPKVVDIQVLINTLVRRSGHKRGADVHDVERTVVQIQEDQAHQDGRRSPTGPPAGGPETHAHD